MARLTGFASFALAAAALASATTVPVARSATPQALKSNASYAARNVKAPAARNDATGSLRRGRKKGRRWCSTTASAPVSTDAPSTSAPVSTAPVSTSLPVTTVVSTTSTESAPSTTVVESSSTESVPVTTVVSTVVVTTVVAPPSTTESSAPVTTQAPPSTTESSAPVTTQAPPTTTSETVAPATTTAAPANAAKRGISADWSTPNTGAAVGNMKGSKFYAHYNWGAWKFDNLPDGIDYWPMLHDDTTISNGDWTHVTQGYATTAMGMNEVNQSGQAMINVTHGIDVWNQYLSPLKSQGYRLVSHSTNQADDGLQWHTDFRNQCSSCYDEIDMYSVHWYGTDAQAFKDYVSNFYNTFQKPIVVTEFAYTDWVNMSPAASDVQNFMTDTMSWMDSQDYVYGYMWFGMWDSMPGGVPGADSLIDANGSPKDLGNTYLNA